MPPLVYRTGDPALLNKRTIRPTVGFGQQLLRGFLQSFIAGKGCCTTLAELEPIHTKMSTLLAQIDNPSDLQVDCFFGKNTELATRIFQLCQGLKEDGKIGPRETWPALIRFEPCHVIGPVKPAGSPSGFCDPLTPEDAALTRENILPLLFLFLSKLISSGSMRKPFSRRTR